MRTLPVLLLTLTATAQADEVRWFRNAERAMEAARKERKLVMLELYDPAARGGRALEATFANAQVQKSVQAVVPLQLDPRKTGNAFARRFKVRTVPMVLFLQPTGSVVWRVAGPTPPVSFSQQIAKARKLAASPASPGRSAIFAAAVNDVESAVRTVAKATKDPWAFDAYNQIGDCYQTTNQIAKAIPWFTKALQAKDAETREYAQVSLASCYMISRQPNKAKPILEQLAKGHSEHAQWARGALGPRPSRSPVAQQ